MMKIAQGGELGVGWFCEKEIINDLLVSLQKSN
jgi:hypothetical protein